MAGTIENGNTDAAPKPTNGRKEVVTTGRKKTFLPWTIIGLVVRLAIWYTLLTPFLRCPSNISDLNDTSPRVCKPYLIARSHVQPHVTPYYDVYAAPYVDQARPYVDVFNQNVYAPTSKFAQASYDKYGAPALEQAQAYGIAQWKAQVTPRVQQVHDRAYQLYLAEVDPYIQQGVAVVSPYYQKANSVALTVYWDHLVPFYTRSQPFIGKTYSTSHDILTTHVMPGARYTWSSVVYFANSSLWPHLTGLYSEQVEPQLVKIGQRLASYREGKRLRAVLEEIDNSSDQSGSSISSSTTALGRTSSDIASASSSSSPSPSSYFSSISSVTTEAVSVAPTLSPAERAQQDRERIDSDLERWQAKFAAAADSGIEDLEERLQDIVGALVSSSANSHGLSLSTALQSVATKQLDGIKQRINELVGSLPEYDAPEDEENAANRLVSDIRASAISVRDRAHALREWSLSFDVELLRRVSAAVNSTLDVLDGIRDLGLQEIGMRWAWMDGVTYKDWARYRAVKAQLQDWRDEIHRVGMNHRSVAEAKAIVSDILDHGMDVAQETAVELVRLKDVGHWKLAAREVSDNFETRMESPPPPPPKPVVEVDEPEDIAAQEQNESKAEFEETARSTLSGGEDDIVNESPETSSEVEDDEEESILADTIEGDAPIPTRSAWGGVAAAEAHAYQAPILDNDEQDVIHNVASQAEDVYSEAYSQASSAFADSTSNAKVLYNIAKSQLMGQVQEDQLSTAPAHSRILSSIESAYSGALSYATADFDSKIAMASPTPLTSVTGPLAQISSIASSRLSECLNVASEQLAHIQPIPSETSSAGLQPFVLDAQRRYYEAVGLAHDHYTAFVSTASHAVYGTPTPTSLPRGINSLVQEARFQYTHASSLASASLAAVVASASSMAVASEDQKAQGLIADASSRYEAALSAASKSLSLASQSASSALFGTTPGPLESLSSQASENWESLISKASEQIYGTPVPYLEQLQNRLTQPQFDAVKGVVSELLVGKEPSFTESVMSRLRAAYETPYPTAAVSSASSYVSETYESASSVADVYIPSIPNVDDIMQNANEQINAAVEAASIGVYGTPLGRYEKATSTASEAYAVVSAEISNSVYGKEPGYIDVAKEHIEEIQSKASAAIYGEEPGAVESGTSRLAAAVEDAQSQLAEVASRASSAASEAADTAASRVGEATSTIKAAVSASKDEL